MKAAGLRSTAFEPPAPPATSPLARARRHATQQQWAAAVPLYQAAVQAEPEQPGPALELALCLHQLGLLDEAVVVARRALSSARQLPPPGPDGVAAAQLQLAHLYAAQRRHDDAGAAYSCLLGHPVHGRAAALGVAQVWLHEGYPSRALQALQPFAGDPAVAHQRALALFDAGDAAAACGALEPLLFGPQPGPVAAPHALSNALMYAAYLQDRASWIARLAPLARSTWRATAGAQSLTQSPAQSPAQSPTRSRAQQAQQPQPGRQQEPPASAPGRPGRDRTRALRVGFVSSDFREHPVGHFLASFLPHLAAQGVQVLLFDNGTQRDTLSERLRRAAAHHTPIASLDTVAAVQAVQAQSVDLLVDLSGHTQGHRLDLFAARAAAVQASYLGYFDTTHVEAIDWLITDAWHVPAGEEPGCTERVARLPVSRFCWRPPDDAPEPAAPPPRLRNGTTTYGACANVAKLGEGCIALWSGVLRADPASRLVLRWKSLVDEGVRQALRERFARHGIAPGRVELHGSVRHAEMMAAYADIDVVLDPWPFGGATTACEALWMGVPVVTLPADRPAGRQAQSLLHAIGRAHWIAEDAPGFARIAGTLAADLPALAQERQALRGAMRASTLTDGARFAAAFAALLRTLVR